MNTQLVPSDFKTPLQLKTPEFIISKLTLADAERDYDAVISSVAIIRKTRGGRSWPSPNITLAENKKDLAWHEREFENRTSFAYKVLSADKKEYIGCLYLYPPGFMSESSKNADVDVSFWVTQKAYDEGLYEKVYKTFDSWLKTTWPFKKIVCTNKEMPYAI